MSWIFKYLCDGADDCATGYDEDKFLCTAGKKEWSKCQIVKLSDKTKLQLWGKKFL